MFQQNDFGERIRMLRRKMNYTQKEIAAKIGVSEQAISKWENGGCLPDVYHLKLLALAFKTTIDDLLNTETEKVIKTIKVGEAQFELVEKPRTILAGRILYAKDFSDMNSFYTAIDSVTEQDREMVYDLLVDCTLPINDIHLSVNFWRDENTRAYGFVREVENKDQPEDVQVYIMPPSLYIRAYTDSAVAKLMAKEECEVWELFAYIRDYLMPVHQLIMADNGAQELEVFDMSGHKTGWAYVPVSTRLT